VIVVDTNVISELMRGEPHPRPPFPSVKGVWDKPSNNNNVETYSNVPQIILNGAAWYSSMGTEKSKGTKTFAVGGNVVVERDVLVTADEATIVTDLRRACEEVRS